MGKRAFKVQFNVQNVLASNLERTEVLFVCLTNELLNKHADLTPAVE